MRLNIVRSRGGFFGVLSFLSLAVFCEAQEKSEDVSPAMTEFRRKDTDKSGSLSLGEFAAGSSEDQQRVRDRDFRVLDFDHNNELSFAEFALAPGVPSNPQERGKVPDPIADVYRTGLKAWQQRLAKNDRDGDKKLSRTEWAGANWRAIVAGFDDLRFEQWDVDQNGFVTDAEVERVFDVAFGFRLPSGEILRQPDDCFTIDWLHVKSMDPNRDGQLSREEFVSKYSPDTAANAATFDQMDQDGNGIASPAEIIASGRFHRHTLATFLGWDKNLDGLLDRDELVQTCASWQRSLAIRLIPAFDTDRDGKLSFGEYHASPFADFSSDWYFRRTDTNHDGALSWAEYLTEVPPRLVGLSRYFFDRFDLNFNGSLSFNELEFEYDSSKVAREALFKAWDRSGDGYVSVTELVAFVPSLGTDATAAARDARLREYATEWLNRADTNHDGQLSRFELKDAEIWFRPSLFIQFLNLDLNHDLQISREEYVRPALGAAHEAAAKAESQLFDLDDNGFFNWKEYLASPRGSSVLEDRFFGLDRNENRQLDLDEFLHIFPDDQQESQRRFHERMDANGDGIVDRAEWFKQGQGPLSAKAEFRRRDKNGDGNLTVEEFNQFDSPEWVQQRRRDFHLVDWNKDDLLTYDEMRCLPYFGSIDERGLVPDPVVEFMQQKYDQFMRLFRELDSDRDGVLDLASFRRIKFASLGQPFTEIPVDEWDRDHNGNVSDKECQLLLEIVYGVRSARGELVRTPTGRMVNALFLLNLDVDRDGILSRDEFVAKFSKPPKENEELFKTYDKNADGWLDWPEIMASAHLTGDILNPFFQFDKNLDGLIDQDEVDARLEQWQRSLTRYVIPAFDDDKDGRLSFREFRFSPLGNTLSDWFSVRKDPDMDGKLSWTEYQAPFKQSNGSPIANLGLLVEYFQRFDRNHDGQLDHSELEFTTPSAPVARLFRIGINDQEAELLVDLGTAGYDSFGSPVVSPDGAKLAFDAAPANKLQINYSRSRMFLLELKGPDAGKVFDLGWGVRPEFSPDGKRIAFMLNGGTPSGESPGIWVSNVDGTERRLLSPNLILPGWSSDGKTLLCTTAWGGTRKAYFVDVETGKERVALNDLAIEGVPRWEPHGDRIAVALQFDQYRALSLINSNGDVDSIEELACTNKGEGATAVAPFTSMELNLEPDSTLPKWSSNGRDIFFSGRTAGQHQIFRIAASGEKPATPVENTKRYGGNHAVPSPDGKTIYFGTTFPLEKLPPFKNPNSPFANKTAEARNEK